MTADLLRALECGERVTFDNDDHREICNRTLAAVLTAAYRMDTSVAYGQLLRVLWRPL